MLMDANDEAWFGVQGLGEPKLNLRCPISLLDLGFRVLGFRVLGFRVYGLGFRGSMRRNTKNNKKDKKLRNQHHRYEHLSQRVSCWLT